MTTICVDFGVCLFAGKCISDVGHTNYNPKIQALWYTITWNHMAFWPTNMWKYISAMNYGWVEDTTLCVLKVTQPCFRVVRFCTYCTHSLPLGHSVPICACSIIFPPSYYCLLVRACLSVCVFRAEWGHIDFSVFPSIWTCSSSDSQPSPLQDQGLDHLSAPSVTALLRPQFLEIFHPVFALCENKFPFQMRRSPVLDQSSIQFLHFSLPDSNL